MSVSNLGFAWQIRVHMRINKAALVSLEERKLVMTPHRRKARSLRAATPTTKDRAVAQLEPNPTPRLKALGGGEADSWNRRIGQTLAEALPK